MFDYVAKEGKRRAITVTDRAVLSSLRTLTGRDNGLDALFCRLDTGGWHQLHSHDIGAYIAEHSGGHFTARSSGPGMRPS